MSLLRILWNNSVHVAQTACTYFVFTSYVMEVTVCMGPSMLPTFNAAGDVVISEHFTPRVRAVKPGDVVVARSPTNPHMIVCKRVLATQGETVTVYPLNDREYVRNVKIPKGHVWLQGDNQFNSTDSRHYGPVPAALVKGRVVYKIWPPGEWGPVESRIP